MPAFITCRYLNAGGSFASTHKWRVLSHLVTRSGLMPEPVGRFLLGSAKGEHFVSSISIGLSSEVQSKAGQRPTTWYCAVHGVPAPPSAVPSVRVKLRSATSCVPGEAGVL